MITKLTLASALAMLSVPALAADLPNVKGPPVFAPPVLSWTGLYLGASVGYGWSADDVSTSASSVYCNPGLGGCPQFGSGTAAAVQQKYTTRPSGFIGGGQIGYNYQQGRFVFGLESDFSGTDIHGSSNQSGVGPLPGGTVSVSGTANQRLSFLGTVRPRFGFTPINPLLLYVTGGLAYGHVNSSTTLSETVNAPCFCGPNPTGAGSFSGMRVGWTIGGGVEWMLAPNLSLKTEYLYYQLADATYAVGPLALANGGGTPFTNVGVSSRVDTKGNIIRVGLNYHFDMFGPSAPIH